MRKIAVAVLALALGTEVRAAVQTETVAYKDGRTKLEGFVAYDPAAGDVRPGVLLVHAWMGLDDFARAEAQKIAALGYTVFALDMYGKDARPKDAAGAGKLSGSFKKDRALTRARAAAGWEAMKRHPRVDAGRTAVVGYCFGGLVALELARSGAKIDGAVSVHGNLNTPKPLDAENVQARVLVLHGANDPYVPWTEVSAFQEEMRSAAVDWQLIVYAGAVHAFTDPAAGTNPDKGAAYHPEAAAKAWEDTKTFLARLFP
jgi:dienelactone hydrolase